MQPINNVPTTRVSEPLIARKTMLQLQFEQSNLFRLQNQIATGRRVERPSDDPSATQRAMGLQRLREQKGQAMQNLRTAQSFLGATDTALARLADTLNEVHGQALAVSGTTSGPSERTAAALAIRQAIAQLVETGNQRFRGRYLFAGSSSGNAPFQRLKNGLIRYGGNEKALQTFPDLGLLVDTNVPGSKVFGAISAEVRGSVDLNPVLTEETRLDSLRGGRGVRPGSIVVSDGSDSVTIDLSSAQTLGDVIRLLESNPPFNRRLEVSLTPIGLHVALDEAGGGRLTIAEAAGGTTARSLGILDERGEGGLVVIGRDLDPALTPLTRLADILGTRAKATLTMQGENNDLILEAARRGDEFNGVTVQLVDLNGLQAAPAAPGADAVFSRDPVSARVGLDFPGPNNDVLLVARQGGPDYNNVRVEVLSNALPGGEHAAFDPQARTLRIHLAADGSSTGMAVVQAIANEPSSAFSAELDSSLDQGNTGLGPIGVLNDLQFANTGHSGGAANTLFLRVHPGVTTAAEIRDAINLEGTFRAWLAGVDTTSHEEAGTGLVDLAATALTSGGGGVEFDRDAGLRIENGGEVHTVSFATAETVQDLLNVLNGSDANLLAEINEARTGINIRSRLSGADFAIGENGGATATHLGVRTFTESTSLDALNFGLGVQRVEGTDFLIRRRDGVELAIDISSAATVGDVLAAINNHPENSGPFPLLARLVQHGNGIELLHDDPDGMLPLTVLQLVEGAPIQAAADLGLIPRAPGALESPPPLPAAPAGALLQLTGANNDFRVASARGGAFFNGIEVRIVSVLAAGNQALVSYDAGGRVLTIDVDPAATTASTVVQAINDQGDFVASLDTTADPYNHGGGLITGVGMVVTLEGGTAETLRGRDVNLQESRGVFTALARLAQALEAGDALAFQRASAMLQEGNEQIAFTRAELGARQRGLDLLAAQLGDEDVELQAAISSDIDVDLVAAITELTSRKAALEAALRTAAVLSKLTLVDFL